MKPGVFIVGWFALLIALLAVRNLPWHLDDKDQAKQAFTSFEMVKKGQWWFQHTPLGKVATKPPLAGWLSAGLFEATGQRSWELAWRLPGLVCALLTLLILWRAGNRLGSAPLGGFLATGAFGLSHFAQRLATLVRTDILLALFIFLAGYLVSEHVRKAAPWTTGQRWLLFLAVLGSMLTKGPIAYAFLLPGLLAYAWICRRRKDLNHAWSGAWPWFGPLVVFGAWAAIGIAQSPEFYRQVVLVEFLGRFTVGEKAVHHNQPVYFYLGHVLGKFAPWSALLLGLYGFRRVRCGLSADPARTWLICWALGGFLFMSLVPSKRADRIFPVIPPLCLLVAATVLPHLTTRFGRVTGAQLAGTTAILALGISAASAGYEISEGYRNDQGGLVRFGERIHGLGVAGGKRLLLVNTKDEGLLLYTQTADFILDPDLAPGLWESGKVDWLLLSTKDLKKLTPKLQPFEVLDEVPHLPEKFSDYVLIQRPSPASPLAPAPTP